MLCAADARGLDCATLVEDVRKILDMSCGTDENKRFVGISVNVCKHGLYRTPCFQPFKQLLQDYEPIYFFHFRPNLAAQAISDRLSHELSAPAWKRRTGCSDAWHLNSCDKRVHQIR
eukprot:scaffold28_cov515-Prasinococcus_capsulatus_cf.AAC.17